MSATPASPPSMRSRPRLALMVTAALVLLAGTSLWAARGFHTGWTRTRTQVRTIDEITGLEAIAWREGFVPGLDWMAAVVLGAAGLLLVSRLFGRRPGRAPTVA